MPGCNTSMPKRAVPSILRAASRRGSGWPMSLKADASLSVGLRGKGMPAATAANSPKRADWPERCVSKPADTCTSSAATPHFAAAAATSMARAEAPAWRIGSHRSLMLDEPPVIIRPISRTVLPVSHSRPLRNAPSSSGWKGNASTTVATLL